MNSVAPCAPRRAPAGPRQRRRQRQRRGRRRATSGTAGRGRSVGRSSRRRAGEPPAASRRAGASSTSPGEPVAAARREVGVLDRQLAAAATGRRPRPRTPRRAPPARAPARPSTSRRETMWCMGDEQRRARPPPAQQAARSSGPRARSNGRAASARPARGAPPRARAVRQARQVDHRQRQAGRPARSTCTGSPVRRGEGGAQRLVAAHDLAPARGAAPRRRAARQPQRGRDVVGRAPGSSWSRNQSRSWAKESGSGPPGAQPAPASDRAGPPAPRRS